MIESIPAFPSVERVEANGKFLETIKNTGMTLRDYFAAKFAHAELMTCGVPGEACDALVKSASRANRGVEQQIAANAYELADAMLKERSK